jgi:hypothetical protein
MEEMKKAMAVVAAETYKKEISKNRTDVNKHFSLEHINDKMTPAERKIILDKLLAVHKYDLEHDSEYASKFVDGTPETEEEKKKREREEKNDVGGKDGMGGYALIFCQITHFPTLLFEIMQ